MRDKGHHIGLEGLDPARRHKVQRHHRALELRLMVLDFSVGLQLGVPISSVAPSDHSGTRPSFRKALPTFACEGVCCCAVCCMLCCVVVCCGAVVVWSVATFERIMVTHAACPRLFEILTTLTFRALGRTHIVSTALETIAKKKNRDKESSLSTCDQQFIMDCQEHNRSGKRSASMMASMRSQLCREK